MKNLILKKIDPENHEPWDKYETKYVPDFKEFYFIKIMHNLLFKFVY